MLRLGSLFVGPTGIFTVNAGCSIVGRSSSKRKSAQEASQPLVAPDVENVSPNAFKKMYTDHQKVAQRKCLLMQVPGLGIRRFDPQQPTFQITPTIPLMRPVALYHPLCSAWNRNHLKRINHKFIVFLGGGEGSHQWSLFHVFLWRDNGGKMKTPPGIHTETVHSWLQDHHSLLFIMPQILLIMVILNH